ncbi:MAG TPA: hypothetical protein VKQ27_06175, partial [Acetobacteraceae bacterium]|nr:hypothetical protein [Acetobacteraceae bacterium]
DLPAPVLDRRSKGGPDGFLLDIFHEHRQQLREQLLDGLLCHHHVIDGWAVEAALAREGPVRNTDYLRLLQLADAEAWCRMRLACRAAAWSEAAGRI